MTLEHLRKWFGWWGTLRLFCQILRSLFGMAETDRKIVEKLLVTSPIFGGVRNRWWSDLKDLETLLGTWHFSVGDYTSQRTFMENGSMSSTRGESYATWSLEDAVVRITYNERMWETLQRPLDPSGTLGASYTEKPVRATKLEPPLPATHS